MSSIGSQLRAFMDENFIMGNGELELSDTDSFLDSGLIDSMGILELVGYLEDTYGIEVADEDMLPENLDSIANVVAYVNRKKA